MWFTNFELESKFPLVPFVENVRFYKISYESLTETLLNKNK